MRSLKIDQDDILGALFIGVFIVLAILPLVLYVYPQAQQVNNEPPFIPTETGNSMAIVLTYTMYIVALGMVFVTILSRGKPNGSVQQ